jgi:hypothetical protein
MLVRAVNRPDVPPLEMPGKFATEVSYFITPAGSPGVPPLGPNQYWIRRSDAERWLEDLVVEVISPLSAEIKAEVEIDEDQQRWLEWMVQHRVEQIQLDRD